MKIDFEKVGIIASYFAENTKDLYVTKFLKLFYYLDFISYKIRGASITNDAYLKLPYGPVPSAIKNEVDILTAENVFGKEFKSQLSDFVGLESDAKKFGKIVINKTKDRNLKKLSSFELELMKSIAETFKNTKAKVISNQTHKEKPWLTTSNNSVIDYELAVGLDVNKILPNFESK